MKQKIVQFLKSNKVAYSVYYYLLSVCLGILKIFIKTDDKLILFNSFGGRKYDDSPKAIYEVMVTDPRFKDFRLVWAFHQPEKFEIGRATKIKTDRLSYFVTALKARAWITNSSIERGLNFKGNRTFYLNTWHGSPIKKMGNDILKGNQAFKTKSKNLIDVMNTQSFFEADIFSKCFMIPRNHFLEVGLPRNDELSNYTEIIKKELLEKLQLPHNKQIILYCPTYREYEKDDDFGVVLAPPMNLKKWEHELGDKYILLFRAHYEVSRIMEIKENEFVKNVTEYPRLNDLMIVSDILISDYSSIFFDYSIMDKCMFYFTYDYDKYNEKRGMYFDIRDYLSGAESEDELLSLLIEIDKQNEIKKTKVFRCKYMNFYGDATQKTIDCVAEHIMP